jgi:NADP-dependent 3-hydroxy acid dehydrogenase YdfG
MGGVMELSPADFERAWRVNCLGALLASQAVLPPMLEAGRGTLIFSGATASIRGSARFAGLAVGKLYVLHGPGPSEPEPDIASSHA